MVKVIEATKYICPYCNSSYDTEDLASDCREDCVEYDDIIEKTESVYLCEYCDKEHIIEEQANRCEKKTYRKRR